jgi:hypothetical protein
MSYRREILAVESFTIQNHSLELTFQRFQYEGARPQSHRGISRNQSLNLVCGGSKGAPALLLTLGR